jgi:hypothetical protein
MERRTEQKEKAGESVLYSCFLTSEQEKERAGMALAHSSSPRAEVAGLTKLPKLQPGSGQIRLGAVGTLVPHLPRQMRPIQQKWATELDCLLPRS